MPRVFVAYKIPDAGLAMLRSRYDVEVNTEERFLSKEEIAQRAKDSDAVVTLLADRIDKEVISQFEKVKVIANYAVGYDNIDIEAAKEKGIVVTNTPGVLTDATADLTMALLLAVVRRVVEADRFVRKGLFEGWKPELLLGFSLQGKQLGVVGLGRIGKAVALRAKAFGMRVVYYKRHRLDEEAEKKLELSFMELDELVSTSDFISLHVPLTPETHHLIDRRRIGMMKPTAVLINTARGAVVDEKALVEALKERRIWGAGFDVYEFEPHVPEDLLELDNVVLLPHIGSATIETREKMSVMVAENVIAVLEGREPPNRVV
ncbi:MAG: glyoxylate reductase [Thermotogota bacterium]|nr:glyoxylate reductase [Thermotogota bacterium]MDK2864859.1 glyoxylate reductase [Thermotogota bacterium]HCZ06108.1 D-glycerate dehydrogenase [Thermotogota bacterium]